ncbi:low-affinity phosphate transporter PitH [Terrabacter ginsenosidimutans]|jgi:PiT family inorganic phosphate transporter|uniref:Low-affinity phosphate transporter PitH n=1 Tax=Terrabacter ginsenosidimutans TaxID=490575 RepID=A0ABP7CMV3_9MICO
MDTTIPVLGVVAVIALAMGFNYTNGFHDAANAIATSVSTRALTPRVALAMAAVANLFGAFFGTKVAQTIGSGIIEQPQGVNGLWLVAAALVGAIGWNLLTWWFGLPSSSSHALIGGLAGAALVAGVTVKWSVIWEKVVIPMIVSPVVGLVGGYLVMIAIFWLFRRANPGRVTRGFRLAQTASAAAMAFGHGLQDAGKTAGVVLLALNISGLHTSNTVPIWVLLLSAVVISLGTYAGGWRIMRTLGRRIIHLTPPQGFAAETTAASILYVAGLAFGAPISTTHTITASIMGVGATKRLSAVRWGVAGNIVGAWILTFPGAGLVAVVTWYVTAIFR